jgi:hypothetical protein
MASEIVRGNNQACLINSTMVRKMAFSVFIDMTLVLVQLSTKRSRRMNNCRGQALGFCKADFGANSALVLCFNSSWQLEQASAYRKLPSRTPQCGHLYRFIVTLWCWWRGSDFRAVGTSV